MNRYDRWLHEYYFLLAYYGVYAGRFENMDDKQRIGLFVSAGVAAASYSFRNSNFMHKGGTP